MTRLGISSRIVYEEMTATKGHKMERSWFEVVEVGSEDLLGTFHVESSIAALNAYSDQEGFAHYSALTDDSVDAIKPHLYDDGTATAPFTNYEILARPCAAPVTS